MKYSLDTNTCIRYLNGTPAHRFQSSDTVEAVDPQTLARAYEFLQALICGNP